MYWQFTNNNNDNNNNNNNNINNNIIIMIMTIIINNSLFSTKYCRQLKQYDNDNKMVIWKKENSYTRKLRKNNLSSR